MTAPTNPSHFRSGVANGGGGSNRIFKLSCITVLALFGYNMIVKSSSSSDHQEFDPAADNMFPSSLSMQQQQAVFDKGGYDSQAPHELQQIQGGSLYPTDQSYQSSQSSSLRGGSNSEVWDGYAMSSTQETNQMSTATGMGETSNHNSYYDGKTEETNADIYSPTEGAVNFVVTGPDGVEEVTDLKYIHCGPTYTLGARSQIGAEAFMDEEETTIIHEVILLHGAKFTKEDWRTSGILEQLCQPSDADEEEGSTTSEYDDNSGAFSSSKRNKHAFSVVALDLDVQVDGLQVAHAFESLSSEGVISGMPATFVTPSASGKGMVDLAEVSKQADEEIASQQEGGDKNVNLLQSIVQAWIPFACPAVQTAEGSTLNEFIKARIPVLSMYGLNDKMGKEVADKLEALAHAKPMVLGENHPGYLDDPKKFVHTLKLFLTNLDTWFSDE